MNTCDSCGCEIVDGYCYCNQDEMMKQYYEQQRNIAIKRAQARRDETLKSDVPMAKSDGGQYPISANGHSIAR